MNGKQRKLMVNKENYNSFKAQGKGSYFSYWIFHFED